MTEDATANALTPRQKGVRHGVMLVLLSIILVPAYVLLAALFPANDRLIESSVSDTPFEKISQAILLTIFMLGIARLLYALIFQKAAGPGDLKIDTAHLSGAPQNNALPPPRTNPAAGFSSWLKDTGEIIQSQSVTEHTTKSLQRE